ncbi:MAG: PhoX family protein [Acidimicrobiales bacterium]
MDFRPASKEVYLTLTNNSRRGTTGQPGTDPANPRVNNVYGHIIRWRYARDFDDATFTWDLFNLAGDPGQPAHGSTVVGDSFGSPDGIYVDPSDRLWIQTDVSTSTINAGAYAGFGNNQMLAADPSTGEVRRFLVGPRQCEVTGAFSTPDERTMFVGIQHPGERPDDLPGSPANPTEFSSFPGGPGSSRPRSALVAITKDDGGPIGS